METDDIVPALGIIVTGGVAAWNFIKNYQLSKKATFIDTVTSERVKWIEKLRNNISAFCGLTHTWTRSNDLDTDEEVRILEKIDNLRYLIRLQLNPKKDGGAPNVDMDIERLIAEIPELTDPFHADALHKAIDDLMVAAQKLLKEEWDKVKAESKSGDLRDL